MKNSIKRLIKKISRIQKGIRLKITLLHKAKRIIVGAGGTRQVGWISTDVNTIDLLNEKTWKKFFKPNSIEAILAEHVWEHLDDKEGRIAAKICFKYLKRNGYLRIAVPDGFHPSEDYINLIKPNGKGAGAEDHKVLYNYQSLRNSFSKVGFEIKLLEYFDEFHQFHFSEWDPKEGLIRRSKRFDERNQKGELLYTSLILDAIKP